MAALQSHSAHKTIPPRSICRNPVRTQCELEPSKLQFAAANTFSHPRYFEDRMLERHGHERFPYLQPMVSGAKFFGTFPMLPYLMTVSPPADIEYQLGYFRSGTAVYPYVQRPPYQRDAVIVQGSSIASGIIAIP